MRQLIPAILLFFVTIRLFSQSCPSGKEGHIWYFGDHVGLDFQTDPPTVLTNGSMNAYEASAIVSDAAGQLLFYSNSEYVWDRNHQLMPAVNPAMGGAKLSGSESATQILALPQPGSTSIYYLFYMQTMDNVTLPADTLRNFYYAVIDLSLNGGLGDVVSKDNFLFAKTTEKVAGVQHCNGIDWWVLTLGSGSNKFMAWALTAAGLQLTPVVSQVGKVSTPIGAGKAGVLKFSPSGDRLLKIGCPQKTFNGPTWDAYFEVMKFDKATGVVSDPLLIWENTKWMYGGAFSPDGTKVYLNVWTPLDTVYQFDLCRWDAAAIYNSKVKLGESAQNTGQFTLGPDGRIYISSAFRNYLSVIEYPNLPGTASSYQSQAILLPAESLLGMPTFTNAYFAPQKPFIAGSGCTAEWCKDTIIAYHVIGDCSAASTFDWSVSGGTVVQQNRDTAWIKWQQPGPGQLVVHKTTPCGLYNSDTLRVNITDCFPCPTIIKNLNVFVCPGATYPYQSAALSPGQSQSFTLQHPVTGCDSIVTVTVNAFPQTSSNLSVTICPGESFTYNGVSINAGQTQAFTMPHPVTGCDSTVTVTVNAFPQTSTNLNVTVCPGETYTYNGMNINAGQSQSFTMPHPVTGCDSTVTVTVNAFPQTSSNLNVTVCPGESFTYNGVNINAGQTQTFTLTHPVTGCDSIVTVTVNAFPQTSSNLNITVCPGETYAYNGVDISAGQIQSFTLTHPVTGCDSTVTVTVNTFPQTSTNLNVTVCPGETYAYNGVDISAGQTQVFTLTHPVTGCDSIVTVTVNAFPQTSSNLNVTVCPGESHTYNGVNINAGQSQTFTLPHPVTGCDSIVTITVNAFPQTSSNLNVTVCPGETYAYNGVDINAGQTQVFTLTHPVTGCDSTVTVTVNTFPQTSSNLNVTVCTGETFTYNGENISAGQIQAFTLTHPVTGCDSTVTVTVNTFPQTSTNLNVTVCPGETYAYNGVDISAGQSQQFILPHPVTGCDSIVTVTVNASLSYQLTDTVYSCAGTTYNYAGITIQAGSTYLFEGQTIHGCDSMLTVTVLPYPLPGFHVTTTHSCKNTGTGSVVIEQINSSTPPYQISIDEGISWQNSWVFPDLLPDDYHIVLRDAHTCLADTTVSIMAFPDMQVELYDTVLPCSGSRTATLKPLVTGDIAGLSFLWNTGTTQSVLNDAPVGNYSVTISNHCYDLTREISVNLTADEAAQIYVPNVFSITGNDPENTVFKPFFGIGTSVMNYHFTIFDRWGNHVFASSNSDEAWDGSIRNKTVPGDVFVWWLEVEAMICGQPETIRKKGSVTVLR